MLELRWDGVLTVCGGGSKVLDVATDKSSAWIGQEHWELELRMANKKRRYNKAQMFRTLDKRCWARNPWRKAEKWRESVRQDEKLSRWVDWLGDHQFLAPVRLYNPSSPQVDLSRYGSS